MSLAAVLGLAVIMLAWHNIWVARHGRQMSEDMLVLFLYGVIISSGESGLSLLLGGVLGLLLGAGISALAYGGLAVIPSRHLFKVTSVLIAFMAAGMAAQSVAFLKQADIATALGSVVWNTSSWLADNSIPGRVLHTLLGYTGKPTQLQLLVYLATLGTIFGLMKLAAPPAGPNLRLAMN